MPFAPAELAGVGADGPDDCAEHAPPARAVTPPGRRGTGLERRTVRVSVGTAARIRLLAAVLDVPVEHALVHAVPTLLASKGPLHRYRTERRGLLPGDGGDQHITIALHPETWQAVQRRTRADGVRTARVLDAATHPYLDRLARAVSAAVAPNSTSTATPATPEAEAEVIR